MMFSLTRKSKPRLISQYKISFINSLDIGFLKMESNFGAALQTPEEMQKQEPQSSVTTNKDYHDDPGGGGKRTMKGGQTLSKRAMKRQKRWEAHAKEKEAKKLRARQFREQNAGYGGEMMKETEYYFENGLRKVYPYYYAFSTYVKERWFGREILEVFIKEFRLHDPEHYRKSIEAGTLKVNGKAVPTNFKLGQNQLIEHMLHRHETPVLDTPIEILADTEDLLVINKPSSIPCHPCGRYRHNSLPFILAKEYGYFNLRSLYRLDRLTSGVLILPKSTEKAHSMETQVLQKKVQKEYICRVEGKFPDGRITCDQPIGYMSHKLSLMKVCKTGKPSCTEFERISFNGKSSLVRCMPKTGRTHQIRVHLQFLGYPILNDGFYNSVGFGPNRGKGGIIEKAEEEIEQEIMKLHNVGLWTDGENPLFYKRLKELKDKKLVTKGCDSTRKLVTTDCDAAVSESVDMSCSEAGNQSEFSEMEIGATDEPAAKRIKISSGSDAVVDHVVIGNQSEECSSGDISSLVSSVVGENQITTGIERSVHSEPCSTSNSDVTMLESNSKSGAASGSFTSEHAMCTPGSGVSLFRPGFDAEKYFPDEECEDCRLSYIDPTPEDLILYLHAYRYKGPDWDFTAPLPDWAHEDWQDPE